MRVPTIFEARSILHGLSAVVSQINLNASLPSLSFSNNKV